MKKFPKEIIVVWNENDDDESFLMAFESAQDAALIGEKVKAAIYTLETETTITTEVKAS